MHTRAVNLHAQNRIVQHTPLTSKEMKLVLCSGLIEPQTPILSRLFTQEWILLSEMKTSNQPG
jgi:hypothetical protein